MMYTNAISGIIMFTRKFTKTAWILVLVATASTHVIAQSYEACQRPTWSPDVVQQCNISVQFGSQQSSVSSGAARVINKRLERALADKFYINYVLSLAKQKLKEAERDEALTSHIQVCEQNGKQTRCWYEKRRNVSISSKTKDKLNSTEIESDSYYLDDNAQSLSELVRELHDKDNNAGSREITILQNALNSLGFKNGVVDGIYSERTKKALMEFQRSIGEPVNSSLLSTTAIDQLITDLKKLNF